MWPTRVDAASAPVGAPPEQLDPAAGAGVEATHAYLNGRRAGENFPVALRLLPSTIRGHLSAVYSVARVIDDLGDRAAGDRSALLVAFRHDLDSIWAGGTPRAPVLRQLAHTVVACGLSRQPFDDLVEANLRDQTTTVYPHYEALLEYCSLSANPVGHIVLEIFGVRTDERVELSDRICTALQIIEHCQDITEDYLAGRVYLPLADLSRFGVARSDLANRAPGAPVRHLLEFEAERAGALLESGVPLVGRLRGWARLAVAGYVAGGRAALHDLRRRDWTVQLGHSWVRRWDVAANLVRVWVQ